MPTPYSYDRRYPSQAERDLFAKFNRTGRASDYPTYEQWKSVYTSNNWNRDLYNRQRRIKLGESQSATIQQNYSATSSRDTAKWQSGDYSNTIFRRYNETGNPESFPTWNQFQWIYPHSTKADYESARANAPVRQQSEQAANSIPANYSNYISSVRTTNPRYSEGFMTYGERTPATSATSPSVNPTANPRYSEGFMTYGERPNAPMTATPQKSVLPASTTKGKTVAEIWTSVTGLPWRAAKEMGITDGSYAQNIEVLRGLKNGSINKEYVNNLVNGEGVTTEDASYAPGSYPAPTVSVPEARPFGYTPVEVQPMMMEPELRRQNLPAGVMYDGVDMMAPTEREANMAARGGRIYGYDPVWDVYFK